MALNDPDPLFILRTHSSVTTLKFSFLGSVEVLITGSQNGLIEVWNLNTKRPVLHIEAGVHEILYADIIQLYKNSYLIGHSRSGLVQFYRVVETELCFQHSMVVHNVGFASINVLKQEDNHYWLAFPSSDSEVSVTTANFTQNVIYKMKPDGKVGMVMKCILFTRDNLLYLLSAYEDGSICLWNVFKCLMLHKEQIYEDPVMSIDTDGIKVITASTGNTILVHAIDETFHLCQLKKHETVSSGFSILSIRGDQKIVACGSWDGIVRLFGWKRLKPLAILKYHTQNISSIAYSTGNIIGIASRDGKVSIWDVYKNN